MRDQRVRKAELEAEIELRKLSEEQKLLEAESGRVARDTDDCGVSELGVRAHRTLARWWGGLFVIASALAVVSAWWTVNWYLTLTWEKALLAVTLFVLPLIGWMAFLMRARDGGNPRHVQKIICALGLLIVLASVTAGTLMGLGRMAGTAVSEERALASSAASNSDLDAPTPTPTTERAGWAKKLLALAGAGAVILLIIASEVASGLAFDEYVKHMTVVWTVSPLFRRRDQLAELLAENAEAQERARRRPEILRAELTIAGLSREQAAREKVTEEERQATARARAAEERDRRRDSLGFLVRCVVIAFVIALAAILIVVAAVAGEVPVATTVVLLDLSQSTNPEEFNRNVRAVEGLIVRFVGAGEELTGLGIRDMSFGAPVLFRESTPLTAGRFGEHLDLWRQAAVVKWRKTAAGLAPTSSRTDIFGALARAGEEFAGKSARKRLIVLSDMRHVGRGFNLERPVDHPILLANLVAEEALVPRLDGVAVWALGVHAAGIDERRWARLKTFWTEYFRRAGAHLETFTPNRTVPER